MEQNLAAIDVGTNSIHLVVARFGDDPTFEVIAREKAVVRLGSGGGDMKELAPDAIDRGIDALKRFRKVADISDARIFAVATSAVREAENAEVFIERARREAGVDVEVISGPEEARLIHLGVLQAVPVFDQQVLVMDIGGGSTEFLVGKRGETLAVGSLKIGALRLTRKFFADEPVTAKSVEACRRWVRATLAPMAREVQRVGFEVAIGASGTVETVAALAQVARDEGSPPKTFNNFEFTRSEVKGVVKTLVAADTVEKRRQLPGLDPTRADIMLAGALVLECAMKEMGISKMVVSDYALREGALLDGLSRIRGGAFHHLQDLRRRSVVRLMEALDDDAEHSQRVAGLALRLFDESEEWHGLGDDRRELLEAAALLCNVGLFVAHSGHHKHTYYLIRNTDQLSGFTDHEIEVIALVARYHRKSAPKAKHPEFAQLAEADQQAVRVLAAILRVAIALDRTHGGLVRDFELLEMDEGLVLEVSGVEGADLSLEIYTVDERKGLLEEVLGQSIGVFEVVSGEALPDDSAADPLAAASS
jgi:exopolyphosphatase / guanosine-5'-triphosphate,3'-diphosphate pyrophosphatase